VGQAICQSGRRPGHRHRDHSIPGRHSALYVRRHHIPSQHCHHAVCGGHGEVRLDRQRTDCLGGADQCGLRHAVLGSGHVSSGLFDHRPLRRGSEDYSDGERYFRGPALSQSPILGVKASPLVSHMQQWQRPGLHHRQRRLWHRPWRMRGNVHPEGCVAVDPRGG